MSLAAPPRSSLACRLAVALVAALLATACTKKTVVREVPVPSAGTVPAPTDGASAIAPVATSGAATGADAGAGATGGTVPDAAIGTPSATATDTMAGTATDTAFADATAAAPPPRTAGAIDPDTVSGTPGEVADCALALPCRWSSEDGGFAVTVTSGDDVGPRGTLAIDFRVDTLHDTELLFGGGAEAIDASNARYAVVARRLGEGNGNAPLGVLAGAPVEGRLEHASAAGRTSLTSLRIGLVDNGLVHEASFANVPLGPAASTVADCAFSLPCTWTSADGLASVELVSAGGLLDQRRLTAGFTVTTSDGSAVALAGGHAVGVDGTELTGRTHSLGTTSGFESVTATTVAGLPRAGTVDFNRAATTPAALLALRLDLYPDAPVPRWDVAFSNVPLL